MTGVGLPTYQGDALDDKTAIAPPPDDCCWLAKKSVSATTSTPGAVTCAPTR